jgi:DNA-binding MarR family transcriptional regulator
MPIKFTWAKPLMKTWLLIHQIHRLMSRIENSLIADMGLTTRKNAVLLALKHLKKPVTVTDIAKWLDRNSNGISMLINRMEKDDLIIKKRDALDQRLVRVEISQKGKQYFQKAKKDTDEAIQEIFGDLNEEELEKVSILLQKVRGKALDFLELNNRKEITEVLEDEL